MNLFCSTKQKDCLADAAVVYLKAFHMCPTLVSHPADPIPPSAVSCPHTGPSDVAPKVIFLF